MGEADLYAIKAYPFACPPTTRALFIECKSSKNIRFDIDNELLRKQRDNLVKLNNEGFLVYYAFRYKSGKHDKDKRDKWHFFDPEEGMKSFKWNKDFWYYEDVVS